MPSPNAVTLGQLITNARSLADMVNSNFVSQPEWIVWANKGYSKLYDLLISTYGANYQFALPVQFLTTTTQMLYPLPDGSRVFYQPSIDGSPANPAYVAPAFYKCLGVDISYNGGLGPDPNSFITMYPFMFGDRNRSNGVFGVVSRGYTRSNDYRYRILGTTRMHITPQPQPGFTIQLWYAPRLVPLANLTDVVEGVSGWEEIIELDMAIRALTKEESDASVLIAARNEMVQRIIQMASNVDAAAPDYVRDVYGPGSGNGFPGYSGGMFSGWGGGSW